MNDYGVEELVILALDDEALTDETAPSGAASSAEISDALGLAGTMADRLTLLSAMSSLAGNDLVDETAGRVAERRGERSVYRLTDAGRRRARELSAALGGERVRVHDGDETVDCALADVPERFDLSVAEAVIRRSPEGDLVLEPSTDDGIVGREEELARLEDALEATLAGSPRTAVVTGDAGVGKTTLVEAFADRARQRGFDVLVGRSRREGGEPYGPLRDAIEGELVASTADVPFATDRAEAEDAEMYRAQLAALYYQVRTTLADHARERPTVLVVEDLQWADAATVELLAHVGAEVADAPLLLVATYRPSGVDDEHPLGTRLAERSAADRLVELEVAPFDREVTTALVESELGRRGVPRDFVDAIHEGTGGNALFIVETVAQLLEQGALDPRVDRYPDAVDDLEMPDVVGTMIERRFARLDADTRRVLDVGAVLGDPMPVDALVAIAPLAEPRVRERIDLLVGGGVWVAESDDRVRFRSEVLRTTALETMTDERRRDLHRSAGAHLADDEVAGPATVASHYERAGEPERALDHYRRAAAEATDVYAHDVAVDHYERALALARDLGRDETVLDVLHALGDSYSTRGEHEKATKYFRYVRERTDEPERVRRSYRYQAKTAFEASKYDETEAYARRGLEVGGDEVTEEVCWLTDYLGGAYFGRGEYEGAIEHHERLRERAAEIGFTLSLGRAHQNLGDCYANLGDIDRARALVERGVKLLQSGEYEHELTSALNDLAVVYNRAGDHEAAVDTLERCEELADRTGNVSKIGLVKANLAFFALHRGDWEDSRKLSREAREIAERIDDRVRMSMAAWIEHTADLEVGRIDDAIDGFETTLELLHETKANRRTAFYEWELGRAYYLSGELHRAEDQLARAREIAVEHDFEVVLGACKSVRGSIERERDDLGRAIDLQREALTLVEGVQDDDIRQIRRMRLARTLLRAGESSEALEHARRAFEEKRSGYELTGVKIDATYGAAQLAAGDREAARETLEDALERARGLSNEAAVAALRELGRLAALEGDSERARERLEAGRQLAERVGMDVYVPHFDELLDGVDDGRSVRSADAASSDGT